MKNMIFGIKLLFSIPAFAEPVELSPKLPASVCRFQYVENGKPVAIEFRYRKDLANPQMVNYEQVVKYVSESESAQVPKYKAFVFVPPAGGLHGIFPDLNSRDINARKKAEASLDATKMMYKICDASTSINIVGSIQSLALRGIEVSAFEQSRKEAKIQDPELAIETLFPEGHQISLAASIVEISRLATMSKYRSSDQGSPNCRMCAPGTFVTDQGALTPANKDKVPLVSEATLQQMRIEAEQARDRLQSTK